MISLRLIVIFAFVGAAFSQSCTVATSDRIECGFPGISKAQCLALKCCSSDTSQNVPTCYHNSNSKLCTNMSFNGVSGPGFDESFYNQIYQLFLGNLNILGKGGVLSSPDPNYYYHFMKDAAFVMKTYMEVNYLRLQAIELKMKAYVGWVKTVQNKLDPAGYDIRTVEKFQLPEGDVNSGIGCRPQSDGVSLRSAALMIFARLLLDNGQSSYAQSNVLPLIKFDLNWILDNWASNSCDLWMNVKNTNYFWNRASYIYTLGLCQQVFTKTGDSNFAARCSSVKSQIRMTLDSHFNQRFFSQSDNQPKDSAVIFALSQFLVYPILDDKIAKTISALTMSFCALYPINQVDTQNGLPGVLLGRFPEDTYVNGNPWALVTAALGRLFYQGASTALISGFQSSSLKDKEAWAQLLKIKINSSDIQFSQAALNAGDSIMNRLYKYVKNDNGHIYEQIDKSHGTHVSAKDSTWSMASILSALKQRQFAVELLKIKRQERQE